MANALTREERARLALTQSTLKNFATALEMWAADHQGTYPAQLTELVPNYLRQVGHSHCVLRTRPIVR